MYGKRFVARKQARAESAHCHGRPARVAYTPRVYVAARQPRASVRAPNVTGSPQRLRSISTACVLLAGLGVFAYFVEPHYPIREWLLWRYAGYLAATALWGAACLALGFRVLGRLGGAAVRFTERLLLSFACGVLIGGLGIFAAGIAGGLGTAFFFAWPLAMLGLAGRTSSLRLVRGSARLARRALRTPPTLLARARYAFLALGMLAVYLQVATPENLCFDGRWYHLALAEQYVVRHAIERFPEGWYMGAYPQLATWLYTWAFLAPGILFDHVLLCAHLEWLLFLATAAGVGLLVRRVWPRARVRGSAAALFLFPSLLIYDSNLNSGADHTVAFWAIPVALALAVARRALSWRSAVLFAVMASGAALSKYQAIYVLAPAFVVAAVIVVRSRRFALILPALLAMLVLTAPHWLKNVAFYGDPFYPILHASLPSHPFYDGAAEALDGKYYPRRFLLRGSLLERLQETLPVLFTFSFVPHNWPGHEIPQPTFGSLFTLFTLAVPLLGVQRRLWLLLGATYAGVFIWFWTNHQDRFLQTILPWMAAATAVMIAGVWRLGVLARAAAGLLIAFQIAWGSDAFFYPNHRSIGAAPIRALADLAATGYEKRYVERFDRLGDISKVGALLPPDAVVLLHGHEARFGIGRRVVTDEHGYQGGLGYLQLPTAHDVWNAWRALGVTHVMWRRPDIGGSRPSVEALAREAAFFEAAGATTLTRDRKHRAGFGPLRPTPPPRVPRILRFEGCGKDPASGTFEIMARPHPRVLEPRPEVPASAVTVLVAREGCKDAGYERMSRAGLKRLAERDGLSFWARTR